MNYDLIIKNGLVILDNGEVETDVAVKDGKIVAIGSDLGEASEVIDAQGLVVSPGMVDAHVHITDPGGSYRDEWEGYLTGTKACAKGGVILHGNAFEPSPCDCGCSFFENQIRCRRK